MLLSYQLSYQLSIGAVRPRHQNPVSPLTSMVAGYLTKQKPLSHSLESYKLEGKVQNLKVHRLRGQLKSTLNRVVDTLNVQVRRPVSFACVDR